MRARQARKKNGFDHPWNNYQIGLWFYFGIENAVFHSRFGIFSEYSLPITIVINIIHVSLAIIAFINGWIATSADVSDELLRSSHGKSIAELRSQFEKSDKIDLNNIKFCDFCFAFVHKDSKHCRACDRCTLGFDHHCQFLNNCISNDNYITFFTSLFTYSILITSHLILLIVSLYWFLDGDNGSSPLLYLMIMQSLLLLVILIPMYQLLVFHIYLQLTHQSTYSFIRDKQKAKEEEQKEREEQYNQQRRQNSNSNSNSNNNSSSNDISRDLLSTSILTIPLLRILSSFYRMFCMPFIPKKIYSNHQNHNNHNNHHQHCHHKKHISTNDENHRKTHPSDQSSNNNISTTGISNNHSNNNNNNNGTTNEGDPNVMDNSRKYSLDNIELHKINVNHMNHPALFHTDNNITPELESETMENSTEPPNFTLAVLN